MKKIFLLAFIFVLFSTIMIGRFIRPVEATGTIYIRADGSIDPDTAPISSVDNITYVFTDNIYDEIVVQRNNTVVDGAGYTVQGTGEGTGIRLPYISNVTIKNMEIKAFDWAIHINYSSNNTISGNHITNSTYRSIYLNYSSNNTLSGNHITNNNRDGIWLYWSSGNRISGNHITNSNDRGICLNYSSNNTLSGNNITNNNDDGICLKYSLNNTISGNHIRNNNWHGISFDDSSNNTLSGNNITNNYWYGIDLSRSSFNSIVGNNITNNYWGIYLDVSSNNTIYHNNFVDNNHQVSSSKSTNFWDDGYPSGGNYWSDYEERYPNATEIDGSDIWDTPYVIDENNQDNYPLMSPWSPKPPVEEVPFWMQWWLWTIVIAGIVALAGAVYFLKKRKPPTPTAPTTPTKDILQNIHHAYSCHSHLQTL